MPDTSEAERREYERATLFAEATLIVRQAEAESRTLTAEEDARVLELMALVRSLEEQLGHIRRTEHEPDPTQKRSENQ
jgi:hypothetical protein